MQLTVVLDDESLVARLKQYAETRGLLPSQAAEELIRGGLFKPKEVEEVRSLPAFHAGAFRIEPRSRRVLYDGMEGQRVCR